MPTSLSSVLDSHFDVHARALQYRSDRSRILAANLANADTPHYKARDIEFRQLLNSKTAGTLSIARTHDRHIPSGARESRPELLYRNPYQPTLDGNTVETEVEQANFTRNAVQYQASLMFISGSIRGLREAITGGR